MLLRLRVSGRKVQRQQVHDRKVNELPLPAKRGEGRGEGLFWLLLALSACGAPVKPCDGIPCSEGRVCVERSVGKVACEVPDAGTP